MRDIKNIRRDRKALQQRVYSILSSAPKFIIEKFFNFDYCWINNVPDKGPCLIPVKHQTFLDPSFVGYPLKIEKRQILPNYVTRPLKRLPVIGHLHSNLLIPLGSVLYHRPRELVWARERANGNRNNKMKTKEAISEAKKIAREENNFAMSYLKESIKNGDHIIFFPEGKMILGETGKYHDKFFKMLEEVPECYVVPAGIEIEGVESWKELNGIEVLKEMYKNWKRGNKTRVIARFGERVSFNRSRGSIESLVEHCQKEGKRLSNL